MSAPVERSPGERLHQNWMRDYDPTTGRYLQADPLGLVDGASVYGYVKQSPMRFTDPTGQFIPAVIACLTNVVCASRVYVAAVLVYELLCADTTDEYIAAIIKAMISAGNPCKGPLKMICAAPFRGGKGGGGGSGGGSGGGRDDPFGPNDSRPLDDLNPIEGPAHQKPRPEFESLSDAELWESLVSPTNGDYVTTRGNDVRDGNGRVIEAQKRGLSGNVPVHDLGPADPLAPWE